MKMNPVMAILIVSAVTAGCATVEDAGIPAVHLAPQESAAHQTVKRPTGGWESIQHGKFATVTAQITEADNYLLARIKIHNDTSKDELLVSRVYISGDDDVLLKSESAESVMNSYLAKAGQLASQSNAAGNHAIDQAQRAEQLSHTRGGGVATAFAITDSVASALMAGVNAQASQNALHFAQAIQDDIFQNQGIPMGLANEGLLVFLKGPRKPPYKVHVDITNLSETDSMDFVFHPISPEESYSYLRELSDSQRETQFWEWLTSRERSEINTLVSRRSPDQMSKPELKMEDQKESALVSWIKERYEAEHGAGYVPY